MSNSHLCLSALTYGPVPVGPEGFVLCSIVYPAPLSCVHLTRPPWVLCCLLDSSGDWCLFGCNFAWEQEARAPPIPVHHFPNPSPLQLISGTLIAKSTYLFLPYLSLLIGNINSCTSGGAAARTVWIGRGDMWMMQFWKDGGRGGVGSAAEFLLFTTRLTSALRSTSAARPTDRTAISPTYAVVEGCRRVWRWRVC